ncbi:MAG: GAF domain-containing sensor histidine kinase [Pseudanabaena sp. ELA607]|jgi:signal transduction histidine kinase
MLSASPDLIAIAHAQIALLTQGLGASASAVYLAEDAGHGLPPHLVEVVIYPEADLMALPTEWTPAEESFGIAGMITGGLVRQRRQVMPLVYQGNLVGFLMTGREDRDWNEQEQAQIQYVANTLTVACALDRRCQWLQDNQKHSYEQQQRFLSSLFHQLRNPLTAIRTFGQLLTRKILPEDPNHKYVTGILKETWHIQDLISQADQTTPLLTSSSHIPLLPAAAELLPMQSLDISEILGQIVMTATAIAKERKLKFSAKVPKRLPPVKANGNALREVLNNLVDNALKYTPKSGTVKLQVTIEPEHLCIHVQDNGVGIPSSDLPRLFERNFRGRQATGDIMGTGLGLAIAHDLMQQMCGRIDVISQEGQGSLFTVTLERQPEA